MRILRVDFPLHTFYEKPTADDIEDGYVTVISDLKGNVRKVLYTAEHGWNTCGDSNALAISADEMASTYVGWVGSSKPNIINNSEDWFYRIDDLMEEIYMKRADDPQQYESDSEQEYWNNIDELYSALEKARDFAEEIE